MTKKIQSSNIKTAIVTGASGQLGSEICKKLIEKNVVVIATDINPPKNKISAVDYYIYDTTNLEEKKKFYDLVVKKYKTIDILINNVGVAVFTNFEDRTEEEFDYVMNINLKSIFFDIQNFVNRFDVNLSTEARIVNISSIFGVISPDFRNYTDLARKSSEVYGASKAGLIQMTKYFAVHLADRNISVNSISPGGIFNPDNPQGKDFVKNYSYRTPFGRMANTDEIAEAVILFVQFNSPFLTGQNLIIDGGLTCW